MHGQVPHFSVTAQGSCIGDALIEKPTRDAVDTAAAKFVDTLTGQDPSSAAALLAERARPALPAAKLAALGPSLSAMLNGPATVSLTYLVKVVLQKKPTDWAPCPVPGQTGRWDHVAIVDAPEQAHVLLSTQAGTVQTTVELWLLHEDGAWRVNGYWANYTRQDGLTGEQTWELGKQERLAGHTANAVRLYEIADHLLYLGPYFNSATRRDFEQDERAFAQSLKPQPST